MSQRTLIHRNSSVLGDDHAATTFDVQLNQIGFKNNLRDSVCKIKFTDNQRMSSGTHRQTPRVDMFVYRLETLSSLGWQKSRSFW